jgi:hypothetical protein
VTTPKRWIDAQSEADDFERTILRAELEVAPPVGAESDVLKRVLAVVAPIGPGGPGPSGPAAPVTGGALGGTALAKSAATLVTLGKGFALGIGVSVVAVTANHYFVAGSSHETAREAAPVPQAAPSIPSSEASAARLPRPPEAPASDIPNERSTAPITPSPANRATGIRPDEKAPSERAPSAPSVASFPTPEAELAASRLKEEAALLRRARAELRSGALAAAFATLEASRQRFTAPELSQEREALAIELLHRSGERTAAASRAREFLARFPESPHATTVRAFADEPSR